MNWRKSVECGWEGAARHGTAAPPLRLGQAMPLRLSCATLRCLLAAVASLPLSLCCQSVAQWRWLKLHRAVLVFRGRRVAAVVGLRVSART